MEIVIRESLFVEYKTPGVVWKIGHFQLGEMEVNCILYIKLVMESRIWIRIGVLISICMDVWKTVRLGSTQHEVHGDCMRKQGKDLCNTCT